MEHPKDKKSEWRFPPDLAVLLAASLFGLPLLILFAYLLRARNRGDTTLLIAALVLAAIGIVLLFFARLPLYRERHFFTFGPGALDTAHRKLYRWAYGFILASALLPGMLLLFLR